MVSLDKPAPKFSADTNQGKISLEDFKGKWVILFAYPADFTPICEADIIGFAQKKAEFDEKQAQFIGWSVDPVESHQRWINEIRERTGVEIRYPLIADHGGKLAKEYDIFHNEKSVTYRGLFIIDPDGILKFAATYPIEVGRSTKEVERILKVLQRARELRNIEESARAKELSKYNE